ncbi:hypothetical protein AB0756_39445 [Tolypothrix campylonemoides VB511288_2]|uniref:Uncharacterized protein n=3 Tax=Nostocales TaxID=1161 RepID=A0A0C1NLX1_9CYAN
MLFEKADIPFPKKMYYFTQLVATIDYRHHYFYVYHYPELVAFNWLVIVNGIAGGLVEVGVHWVSCREDAELWGKLCIDAIYTGKHSEFLEESKKAGQIPKL